MINLKNKKILIIGMGITGESIANYLENKNITFFVLDNKPTKALKNKFTNILLDEIISDKLLSKYDVLFISPGVFIEQNLFKKYQNKIYNDISLFCQVITKNIIAITGTNGKSTVVKMIEHIINKMGKKAIACGNIGLPVLDLLQKKNHYDYYILEISSFQLDLNSSFNKKIAVVLNIEKDHLDRYENFTDYKKSKLSIFKESEHKIINSNIKNSNIKESNKFGTDDEKYNIQGQKFNINDKIINAKSYNKIEQINQLATLAILDVLNFDTKVCNEHFLTFKALNYRMQFIGSYKNSKWFNDSKATNSSATFAALESQPEKIVLIAGGSKKDEDFLSLKSIIKEKCKSLILIGQTAQQIAQVTTGVQLFFAKNLKEAIIIAQDECGGYHNVLFSPASASFDMFKNYQQRGYEFNRLSKDILDL